MKRYFGQNFLKNKSIINSIVDAIGIERNDFVLEIGPGRGALTDVINCNFGGQINFTIIEKDTDLIPFLIEKYSEDDIRVVNNDFLKFDLNSYLMKPNIRDRKVKVFGNLPYNVSSPILFKLLFFRRYIKDQHVMLQKEVADRLIAFPRRKSYGRLSVLMQSFYDIEHLINVDAINFYPVPKVQSVFLRMRPNDLYVKNLLDEPTFFSVVKQAFSMKRKMIKNCLSGLVCSKELENLDVPPTGRAEQISVGKFVEIANFIYKKNVS